MEDLDTKTLIETEQRSLSNAEKIEAINEEIKEIKTEQKAIHTIATSVEVIAAHMSHIEEKVDETNRKVDETNQKFNDQVEAWRESERKLTDKIAENESVPYKKIAQNVNSIKVAIITCICTTIVAGVIGALLYFR